MNKGIMTFVKGIAVGCIAGAVGNSYMHANKKGLKKMWERPCAM